MIIANQYKMTLIAHTGEVQHFVVVVIVWIKVQRLVQEA